MKKYVRPIRFNVWRENHSQDMKANISWLVDSTKKNIAVNQLKCDTCHKCFNERQEIIVCIQTQLLGNRIIKRMLAIA